MLLSLAPGRGGPYANQFSSGVLCAICYMLGWAPIIAILIIRLVQTQVQPTLSLAPALVRVRRFETSLVADGSRSRPQTNPSLLDIQEFFTAIADDKLCKGKYFKRLKVGNLAALPVVRDR